MENSTAKTACFYFDNIIINYKDRNFKQSEDKRIALFGLNHMHNHFDRKYIIYWFIVQIAPRRVVSDYYKEVY